MSDVKKVLDKAASLTKPYKPTKEDYQTHDSSDPLNYIGSRVNPYLAKLDPVIEQQLPILNKLGLNSTIRIPEPSRGERMDQLNTATDPSNMAMGMGMGGTKAQSALDAIAEKFGGAKMSVPKLDKNFSKKVADAFEELKHNPNDPEVKSAYNALVDEAGQHYDALQQALNLQVHPIKGDNPYKSSKDLISDVKNNSQIHYYPTESGFGSKVKGPLTEDQLNRTLQGHTVSFTTESGSNGGKPVDVVDTVNQLNKMGEDARITQGKYKDNSGKTYTENSILVSNPKDLDAIKDMAKQSGQESIIINKNNNQHTEYLTGDKAGTIEPIPEGGFDIHTEEPGAGPYTQMETKDGTRYFTFGGGNNINPMLSKSGRVNSAGEEMLNNDVFRVVHDVYGHVKNENGFGPLGEETAYANHREMFSPLANKALATETRGQNSYVNYGPNGEFNRANPENTIYADQKMGILPDWAHTSNAINKDASTPMAKPLNADTDNTDQQAQGFAEGGEVSALPTGFTLDEPTPQASQPISPDQSGLPPGFELNEDKYGSVGQMAKTAVEGAAEGVLGPLAPLAETSLLGVKKSDILGRKEENPITQGVGQAAGLGASMMTGVGEGALMAKAGQGAAKVAGLGAGIEAASMATKAAQALKAGLPEAEALAAQAGILGAAAKNTSFGYKVGSSVVSNAAEMAFLQGSDEVSKMVINDPSATAQNAIANIGLSAALGGVTGAALGSISPLWHATAGPKVEQLLGGLKNHLNGGSKMVLPEVTDQAIKTLGIEVPPVMRAAISGDAELVNHFNVLKEVQHPEVLKSIEEMHAKTSDSVMNSLGVTADDVSLHSTNEAGHEALDAIKKEFNAKYGPIEAKYAEDKALSQTISIPDESRLAKYGEIIEKGISDIGTDSPYYKLYEEYGNRILAKETVGGMDTLKTEINNRIKGLKVGGDYNVINALSDIKSMIGDLQESEIVKQASALEKSGMKGATELGAQTVAERAMLRQEYAQYAKMADDFTNHMGIGDFYGTGGLMTKLSEKLSPEQLIGKLSIRNNADFIPFLTKHFPETLDVVKQNELKQLLKPAVLGAKGENSININKLSDAITKGMAGKPEYIKTLLSPEALAKIDAAKVLTEAIPNPKSSGTAGWMSKIMSKMPQSALAGVALVAGHNPIAGYLGGEMAQRLGRNAPDAIRLGYLKFMGSEAAVSAGGFKSMVDFLHNTYNGNNIISKATSAVFQSSGQVLANKLIPTVTEREHLDKTVTMLQSNSDKVTKMDNGQLGHYMDKHQAALTETSIKAAAYLGELKPKPYRSSPLDKEIQPTKAQEQRYNRALDIAQQPAMVMHHIKEGTLQASDIQDLNHLYPELYSQMKTQVANQMITAHDKGITIPYKTRIGLSLFLGQAQDSTMTPMSIQAAQPIPAEAPQQGGKAPKGSTNKLSKMADAYKTTSQTAESDRSNRK